MPELIDDKKVLIEVDESILYVLIGLGITYSVFKKEDAKEHSSLVDNSGWQIPVEGYPFLNAINKATRLYNLPPKLLGRVAYQESRFRPDIITGKTKSPAGALGIMQIIPKWHPAVDPLAPTEAILYAASYLRELHDRFGNWKDALAAYNWGPTNLAKFKKGNISYMPRETINYINDISNDVLV